MTDIDEGGSAFPYESFDPEAGMDTVKPGMSLRAWLAGQALVGMGMWEPLGKPRDTYANKARWACAQADAIIAELRNHPHD